MRWQRRIPYRFTVKATSDRFYRKLIERNLPTGEWRVMLFYINRWFRHGSAKPLAYSTDDVASALNYSACHMKRLIKSLIQRGFLRLAFGGVGRGKVRRFAVDLTAIRQAFAPDLVRSEKVSSGGGTYKEELSVARRWLWFTGLWGRDDGFRRAFRNALWADARATWRLFVPPAAERYPTAAQLSLTTFGEVEAMA